MAEILLRFPADIEFHDVPPGLFRPDQRVLISGTHNALEESIRALRGEAAPASVIERIRHQSETTREDIGVVEMIVTGDSRLVGRTLPTPGIADLYDVAVIGIHRPERLIGGRVDHSASGDLRIGEGDVLLVMGLPHAVRDVPDQLLIKRQRGDHRDAHCIQCGN